MSSAMLTDPMGAAELTRYAPYVWQPNSGDLRPVTVLDEPTVPMPRVPEPDGPIHVRDLLAREGRAMPLPKRTWLDRLRSFLRKPQWKTWLVTLAVVVSVLLVAVGIVAVRDSLYTPVVSPDVPVETLVRGGAG